MKHGDGDFLGFRDSQRQDWSLVAKCPAESRAGAVVASGKALRRPVVPVAIKRDMPREVASDFDVIAYVHVELHTAGLRDDRKKNSVHGRIGLVEPKEL